MILICFARLAYHIKRIRSKFAIKINSDSIVLNHGLLFNKLKIPFKAISTIDSNTKEIHITNLYQYSDNKALRAVFKLCKTNRLSLDNIFPSDIRTLKQVTLNKQTN